MKRSPALALARTGTLLAYALIVLLPVIVSYLLAPYAWERGAALHVGLIFSLVGFPMLALQPVLSARMKWLDRLFGLDRVYRFHKAMAVVAGVLILIHPLMLALDMGDFGLLTSFDWPWYILAGKLGVLVILVIIVSSFLYAVIRLTYERWRGLHNLTALVLLAVGIVHGWLAGRDMVEPLMQGIFLALLALGVGAYLAHKVVGPALRRRRPYRVSEVRREADRVWTLRFAPGEGVSALECLPGQFQFITLRRASGGRGGRREEHPFTIAACLQDGQAHESTIKESGDFTATIGNTRVEEPVAVQGPFGRFCHLLHPEEQDFVFLAGGIGITPLMAMLRHMAATGSEARLLLLYANRGEGDIAFRDELEALRHGAHPRLEVVHVLEQPPAGWTGETGRITRELMERHLGGPVAGRGFYVCGPPAMMNALLPMLRRMGVPRRRLHAERFAL
ncbi:MAG: ferric reductase-like transmembrane domain-containing protein [Spirochaetales bacterium]|nr:ferric reductase-like transmembrane domain-containing protein [Spirochaetales bacterium]